MNYWEINRMTRRFLDANDAVGSARRQASIGMHAHSDLLERTQDAVQRTDRIAGVAAGNTMRRHLELVDQARQIVPRSVAGMPSVFDHLETARDAAGRRSRLMARSRIGYEAANTIDRIRQSSVRYAFQTNSQIWQAIENARQARMQPIFDHLERARRLQEMFERMDAAEAALEASDDHTSKRLVVLLEDVPWGYALRMKERIIAEGAQAFVELLAEILLEERALTAFRAAVQTATALSPLNKKRLEHALDHLDAGEYVEAFPSLIIGVEGALRDVAKARGVRKTMSNARSAARLLKLEHEHELLIGAIYSAADDGRHGEGGNARDDCVLALLAMVLWIQEEFGKPVIKNWLSTRLNEEFVGGYLAA